MRRLLLLLSVSFLFSSCINKSVDRPSIHVHVSSSVDSALVIFEGLDSVKVINFKQGKDSVKNRPVKQNLMKSNKTKNKKKFDPVPSFTVPRL